MGNNSKSLKDKLSQHPLAFAVALIISAVSTTFAVHKYFTDRQLDHLRQQHDAELRRQEIDLRREIAKAEEKLAFIKLRFGGEDEMSVSSLLVSPIDSLNFPPSVEFFEGDDFYAVRDKSEWTYDNPSLTDLYERISGQSFGYDQFPAVFTDIGLAASNHSWREQSARSIQGSESLRTLFTYISLHVVPVEAIKNVYLQAWMLLPPPHPIAFQEFATKFRNEQDFEQIIKTMEQKFPFLFEIRQRDMANFLTSMMLYNRLQFSQMSKSFFTEVQELNKSENLSYVKFLTTLLDVTVDDISYKRFFIHQTSIVTQVLDRLYLLHVIVPSEEPIRRRDDLAMVNGWLANFAIVSSK